VRVKLLVVFLLIIVIPIIGLGWLGVKTMRDEQEIVKHRLENLIKQKLVAIDSQISKLIKQYERNLYGLYNHTDYTVYGLRQVIFRSLYINQVLVLDRRGRQIFPSPFYANPLEQKFLERSKQFINLFTQEKTYVNWTRSKSIRIARTKKGYYLQQKTFIHKFRPQKKLKFPVGDLEPSPPNSKIKVDRYRGWSIWFWENGINLIYWYKNRNGYLIAAEVSRVKLVSDIIAILPSTQSNGQKNNKSLITLTDARGGLIYQWGHYKPEKASKPISSIDLSLPLNAWTLNYYSKAPVLKASINYLPILFGMSTVILAMIGLAFYFYRESNRELTVAKQRVTFVNQVSHELKTPLTNIRMYAELLENEIDVDEVGKQAHSRVSIIVNESQRLSRLISNVLNFARQQKDTLKFVKSLNRIDGVIDAVIAQFGPTFKRHDIQIEFKRGAAKDVHIDPDLLEQIIHNLFSNIEKYAADGKYLSIETNLLNASTAEIIITDKGPGIPKSVSEKVFEAFFRIDSKLTEGVSGTGIGLSIARELARLHGGDLNLAKSSIGAKFVLTLNIEKA